MTVAKLSTSSATEVHKEMLHNTNKATSLTSQHKKISKNLYTVPSENVSFSQK